MAGSERRRVLVVEDDPDQFDGLLAALDEAGFEVERARDGAEAMALYDRFNPHIVLTDFVMPGMSGDELVRVIRARGGVQPRLLVVSGLDRHRLPGAPVDADGWVRKPYTVEELLAAIEGPSR